MRCSCILCRTYMVHHGNAVPECICPECGNTCRICLGEGTKPKIVRSNDGKIIVPEDILNRYVQEDKAKDK